MLPDKSSVAGTYGGPYTNHAPVEDPTTDFDAAKANELLADVAGATHTVDRAWCYISGQTATGSCTIVDHDANWGSTSAVKPTCVHNPAGTYTYTWATTYEDELGNVKTLNVRKPRAWCGNTTGDTKVWTWTANTVTVHAVTVAGVDDPLNSAHMFVAWG